MTIADEADMNVFHTLRRRDKVSGIAALLVILACTGWGIMEKLVTFSWGKKTRW